MAQEAGNPFMLPGLGQAGDAAGNPLFAGLDMMRQAWQNMAGMPGGSHPAAGALPTLSIDDLDKRIRELQTVHNWLQLNAGMLASAIQGLEIQRSTLQTFQSFADQTLSSASGAAAQAAASQAADPSEDSHADPSAAYAEAAGEWWRMVHQQFEHLAQATAASLQEVADSSEAAMAAAQAASPPKASTSATRKATAKKPAAAAKKPAAAGKTTAKKPAGVRTPTRKAATPSRKT